MKYLILSVFILGSCYGFPNVVNKEEKQIEVVVIEEESPNDVLFVDSGKSDLLTDVQAITDEMEKTTVAPIAPSVETTQTPVQNNPVETTQTPVQTTQEPSETTKPKKTRRTRRPEKVKTEKPKKEYPYLDKLLDIAAAQLTSTVAPTTAVNPNFGTYITNIENLQVALTGMASDIDAMCDEKTTQNTLNPLRNPFIQFLQNITQQQTTLTNTVLNYWSQNSGLNLAPITLPTVAPVTLPTLKLRKSLDEETKSEDDKEKETSDKEIEDHVKGLENAIKKSIKEMLPYMNYIEEFPSESATPEQWETFNEAIAFVATRLRNKSIQEVLNKEKTKNLLENYDKYLSAVQVVRLYREMEEGKDTKEAIKETLKLRKGC